MKLAQLQEARYNRPEQKVDAVPYRPTANDEFHNVLFTYFTPSDPKVVMKSNPEYDKFPMPEYPRRGQYSREEYDRLMSIYAEADKERNEFPYEIPTTVMVQRFNIKDEYLANISDDYVELVGAIILRYTGRRITSINMEKLGYSSLFKPTYYAANKKKFTQADVVSLKIYKRER